MFEKLFAILFGLLATIHPVGATSIPENEKLMASSTDIVFQKEVDGVVSYAYKTNELVLPTNQEKTAISSRTKNANVVSEDVTKRTPHSRTYTTNKPDIFVLEAISGVPQYHEDKGKWYQLNYATTTKASFDAQTTTKTALSLLVKTAFAQTDFFPSSDASLGMWTPTTWAGSHDSTSAEDVLTTATAGYIQARTDSGATFYIYRLFQNFDTSAIGSDNTVTAVVSSVFGQAKGGTVTRSYNIYQSTGADSVVAGDFDNCGTTALSDTAISQASWSTSAYNTFTFNATGISAINKTGITKVCYREVNRDVADVQADIDTIYVGNYQSTQTGTDKDPKLTITYSATPAAATSVYNFDPIFFN